MRNSDDAKLIAGAIEKAGRLISEAIKENTQLTAQHAPRYQIPEQPHRQIIARDSGEHLPVAFEADSTVYAVMANTHEE